MVWMTCRRDARCGIGLLCCPSFFLEMAGLPSTWGKHNVLSDIPLSCNAGPSLTLAYNRRNPQKGGASTRRSPHVMAFFNIKGHDGLHTNELLNSVPSQINTHGQITNGTVPSIHWIVMLDGMKVYHGTSGYQRDTLWGSFIDISYHRSNCY